jgi:hypothetical protein
MTKSPLDFRAFAREPWARPKWVRSAAIMGLWCDMMPCDVWYDVLCDMICRNVGCNQENVLYDLDNPQKLEHHRTAAHGSGISKKVASKPKEDPLQLTCWMVRLPVQVQMWIIQILTCSHMLIHVVKLAESPCDNTCVNLKFVTPWNLMCPSHWSTWCNCSQRWLPNVDDLRERAQPSMLSMLCFNNSIPGYLDVPLSGACPTHFDHHFPTEIWWMWADKTTHLKNMIQSGVILIPERSRHDSSFSGTPGKNVWPVDNYQACWYTQIVCGV